MAEITLVEAVNLALARAMAEDDGVLVLGEDVGVDGGVFRATDGLIARFGEARVRDTPLAEAERKEFMALTKNKPNNITMAYHWARMIEVVHCVEKIEELLHVPDLQGTDLKATGDRREEGIGVIEAPRGNLIHHYKVDENDQVTFCNLIVSTTNNNQAMNESIRQVASKYLDGSSLTEPLLNQIEVAIRAYDPCLSCATHALGKMPLEISLVNSNNEVIDRMEKLYAERAFVLERATERHVRGSGDGYGLGLSIVRNIITNHNGSIRVVEAEGGGSAFIVELFAGD